MKNESAPTKCMEEIKEMKYRYTIILDRYAEEDYGPEATADHGDDKGTHHDGSDFEARVQVAKELQEAMDQTGLPVGFFSIPSRIAVPNDEPLPDAREALADRSDGNLPNEWHPSDIDQ